MLDLNCVFCLTEGAGMIRLDKKGRPFFKCRWCGTKAFMYTEAAFAGLRALAGMVGSIKQTVEGNGAVARGGAEYRELVGADAEVKA